MAEWVEQRICIRFCIKFEHSSSETIWTIQKAAAMDNWWLAASSWQCIHSYITSYAEFFGKTSNHTGDSAPYSPDLVPCDFWLFPKLKSPLKGKRFHTINEIQENTMGQLVANGRTVWSPKVSTLRGLRHHCPMFLLFCIIFNKCLYFSYYMAVYLLGRLYIYTYIYNIYIIFIYNILTWEYVYRF